jgi:Ca-activated chloride channel family protein
MNTDRVTLPALCFILAVISLVALGAHSQESGRSRSKNGRVSEAKHNDPGVETTEPAPAKAEDVRLAVDLVVLDAQVLQQKTGRAVGFMKREDFVLSEDGVTQQITHFGQDSLPLSVLFLIDRGGCLDPFSEKVRRAILESVRRLKPQDEVALMAFHNTTELVTRFGRDQNRIIDGLDHLPPHDEEANHCFNRAFYDAAEYMRRAGNPDGRRVIIVITSVTTYFDCSGPSGDEARRAILESGSVVCGIIPKTAGQRMESGIMRTITGIGGIFKARSSNLNLLAEETGGEVLTDKPDNLDHTFNDLIGHLRTRYVVGFVSTNTRRDGSFRKLKLEVVPSLQKPDSKLIVKTRRGYIAARRRTT